MSEKVPTFHKIQVYMKRLDMAQVNRGVCMVGLGWFIGFGLDCDWFIPHRRVPYTLTRTYMVRWIGMHLTFFPSFFFSCHLKSSLSLCLPP